MTPGVDGVFSFGDHEGGPFDRDLNRDEMLEETQVSFDSESDSAE